jgi:phospholipase/carboxylesterase
VNEPRSTDARRPTLSLVTRLRPARGETADRPPLLLLFHGVGSNELAMASIAAAFPERFAVLSVRGPLELRPFSFAWFHVTFTDSGPRIDAEEARRSWERAALFVDEAVTAIGADPDRVFLAGFSQGGIVALMTLLTAPARIAGAVCMSGRLPPEVLPHVAAPEHLRGKPIAIVHGTHDDTLEVGYGRRAAATLTELGVDAEYREFDMGHTTTAESLAFVSAWLSERIDDRGPNRLLRPLSPGGRS